MHSASLSALPIRGLAVAFGIPLLHASATGLAGETGSLAAAGRAHSGHAAGADAVSNALLECMLILVMHPSPVDVSGMQSPRVLLIAALLSKLGT